MVPKEDTQCAHPKCSCPVTDNDDAVKVGGKQYCSEDCAEGAGCDHEGCRCGVDEEKTA